MESLKNNIIAYLDSKKDVFVSIENDRVYFKSHKNNHSKIHSISLESAKNIINS